MKRSDQGDACKVCHGTGVEPWHARALEFWREVWASPMRAEFAAADVPGMVIGATLVDRFWWTGDLDVAKEIRLWLEKYGLTPLARRSLQWKLPKAEAAALEVEEAPRERPAEDPRKVLRMVAGARA